MHQDAVLMEEAIESTMNESKEEVPAAERLLASEMRFHEPVSELPHASAASSCVVTIERDRHEREHEHKCLAICK